MKSAQDATVLIVDDEPDVRRYLQTILEDAGFNVLTAGDGEEALTVIRDKRPDFISLDLIMPRKTGHKLLHELKKDKELARIPVLIVTAHAKDELGKRDLDQILESSLLSGPGIYLEKPVQPASFVRCVQQALGIEPTPAVEDKTALKDELDKEVRQASAEALREALKALKKKG